MRQGFLELLTLPNLEFYKTAKKSGSRLEYSIKLTKELQNLGKKFSNLPLKFASLIKAFPSNEKHQEFHADSEDGERALLYLTDVENESNGPIEFQNFGKILGKAGTFVHYSANEVHRGCASDINRYALAFAFDNSEKTITTIGRSSCEEVTCPDGYVYKNPLPNSGEFSEETCCEIEAVFQAEEKKFPWTWIILIGSVSILVLLALVYYFYKYPKKLKL